jgi:acylphosphatase
MPEVYHETVHFSGRVQGVGFRYSVLQVAKEYEVCGFVKNLTDGRVYLEVEGSRNEIAELVSSVHERMDGYIRQVERKGGRRDSQFKGFEIR